MATLEIDRVRKSFANIHVLKEVNVSVGHGDFLVLLGPSGCGKSTLLNLIAGLESITSGEIRIDGEVINDRSPKDRDIAMVFQSYALYPTMTVRQNIEFGMKIRGIPAAERAAATKSAADMLQMSHLLDRRPSQLSGGQRQRVAMGRAIVRDPKLFLFDEPLSNLDAKLRVDMRTEIKRLHQRLGTTIVYVTHDQIEAMTLATKIAVMKDGVVQHFGPPQEVYNRPANTYVAKFVGSPAMNIISAILEEGPQSTANARISLPSGETEITGLTLSSEAIKKYHKKNVLLGIRPEHFSISARGSISVKVDVVEPTGPDTLAVFGMGGTEVIARLEPFSAESGETLKLSIKTEKIVVFDTTTEMRVD